MKMASSQKILLTVFNFGLLMMMQAGAFPTASATDPHCSEWDDILNMCLNVTTYPTQAVEKFLNQSGFLPNFVIEPPPETGVRAGMDVTYENLCKERQRMDTPRVMRNVHGESRFIVQKRNEVFQAFRFTICDTTPVAYSAKNACEVFKGHCFQKYFNVKLLVWDGSKVTYDMFRLANGCHCGDKL